MRSKREVSPHDFYLANDQCLVAICADSIFTTLADWKSQNSLAGIFIPSAQRLISFRDNIVLSIDDNSVSAMSFANHSLKYVQTIVRLEKSATLPQYDSSTQRLSCSSGKTVQIYFIANDLSVALYDSIQVDFTPVGIDIRGNLIRIWRSDGAEKQRASIFPLPPDYSVVVFPVNASLPNPKQHIDIAIGNLDRIAGFTTHSQLVFLDKYDSVNIVTIQPKTRK